MKLSLRPILNVSHTLFRILKTAKKELKIISKDKPMMFLFFIMTIIVISIIKFTQHNVSFGTTIGIIDLDNSTGYRYNDSFSYVTLAQFQEEWQYNSSVNTYLNLTKGQVVFNTSTALENEMMYFRKEFNRISDLHNALLISKSDVWIINASLSAFTVNLGYQFGSEIITACSVGFNYGNITAANGTSLQTLQSVANNTLYQIEMNISLENQTYSVKINESVYGTFDFSVNISSFNIYQNNLYPSSSLFDSINIILDNVNITVDSTPTLDLSYNLTQYIAEESDVIYFSSEEDAMDALLYREIVVYLIINESFETNITQDLPFVFDLITDGTNINDVPEAIEQINVAIIEFREEHEYLLDFIVVDTDPQFTGGVIAGDVWMALLIPPTLGIAFIGSSMLVTSISIVDDKPLPRLLLSPLRKSEVIIGKFIAYSILSLLQSTIFFIVWLLVLPLFGWTQIIMGSIFDSFCIITSISITGIGFGFMVSAISRTKYQAILGFLAIFIVFIAVWLLRLSEIDPLSLGEVALVNSIFKGLPLSASMDQILTLLGFSLLTILLGFLIYRQKKYIV
jgi:hypothetical protein